MTNSDSRNGNDRWRTQTLRRGNREENSNRRITVLKLKTVTMRN